MWSIRRSMSCRYDFTLWCERKWRSSVGLRGRNHNRGEPSSHSNHDCAFSFHSCRSQSAIHLRRRDHHLLPTSCNLSYSLFDSKWWRKLYLFLVSRSSVNSLCVDKLDTWRSSQRIQWVDPSWSTFRWSHFYEWHSNPSRHSFVSSFPHSFHCIGFIRGKSKITRSIIILPFAFETSPRTPIHTSPYRFIWIK